MRRLSPENWRSLERRAAVVYSLIGLALSGLTFYLNVRTGIFGWDFRGSLWKAANDILGDRSPYLPASSERLAHVGNAFVYPPLAAFAALPLAVLPQTAAAAIWSLGSAAALAGALWLVGLRDWRCYALCLGSYPVADTLILGQLDGLLALAAAAAWRFRNRVSIAGVGIGFAIALKLLAWPLFVWLLFTRRFKAAAVCLAATTALVLGPWAVIGFRGLTAYPHLVAADADAFQNRSHSLVALALRAGLTENVGRTAAVLAALGLLEVVRRDARTVPGELFAFAAALAAGIVASPVVHAHYWVVLFVPLAAASRSAGWRWLLPLGFWISPVEPPMHTWQIAFDLALAGLLVLTLRHRAPQGRPVSARHDVRARRTADGLSRF